MDSSRDLAWHMRLILEARIGKRMRIVNLLVRNSVRALPQSGHLCYKPEHA